MGKETVDTSGEAEASCVFLSYKNAEQKVGRISEMLTAPFCVIGAFHELCNVQNFKQSKVKKKLEPPVL